MVAHIHVAGVACSVLAAMVLNLVLMINHRRGRYVPA
jgi:hypothetical protein